MQPPYQQPQYPNTFPGRYPRSLKPTQAVYKSDPNETTEPVIYPSPYWCNPYDVAPIPPPPPLPKKRRVWLIVLILVMLVASGGGVGYMMHDWYNPYVPIPSPRPLPITPALSNTPTQAPTQTPQTLPSEAHVYDTANILNVSQVQSAAATLPDPLDIYTTNTFTGSTSAFDQRTAGYMTSPRLIVIAIDTGHRYLAIDGGTSVPLSKSQYDSALGAFVSSFHSNSDYTSATIAAIDSLKSSLA